MRPSEEVARRNWQVTRVAVRLATAGSMIVLLAGAEPASAARWWLQRTPNVPAYAAAAASAGSARVARAGWALHGVPKPAGAHQAGLNGVSCSSPTACTAVGYLPSFTLAERWNGRTWSVQRTPHRKGWRDSSLLAVSCRSATGCESVGWFAANRGDYGECLAEMAQGWGGRTWSIQRIPDHSHCNMPYSGTSLNDVACVSARFCVGAGSAWMGASGFSETDPFLESWNGHAWINLKVPSSVPVDTALFGVACPSDRACFAVGGNEFRDVILRWAGKRWSVSRAKSLSALFDVSCASAASCVAVGSTEDRNHNEVPLVERWNGGHWIVTRLARPAGAADAQLRAVSCQASRDCTAVGASLSAKDVESAYVTHWNGSRWATEHVPKPSGSRSGWLNGVSCTPGACVAVGSYSDRADRLQPLVATTATPVPSGLG